MAMTILELEAEVMSLKSKIEEYSSRISELDINFLKYLLRKNKTFFW
mgnify:CR=1 FL=1